MTRRAAAALAITVIAVAAGAFAIAVLAAMDWPARAYRDSDWMQYYAGASAILARTSPWDMDWWRAFHERLGSTVDMHPPHTGDPATDWTTPYPLWTFVLLLPFGLFPLAVSAAAFAVTQLAAVLAAAWALARMLLPPRAVLLAVVLVASSQPLWALTAGGNVTGFAAAAFTFALVALLLGRPMFAGVLLAGCLLKPHVFVIAALALVAGTPARDRRPLVVGAIAATLAVVLMSFALRPDWVPQWLAAVSHLQATSMSNATGWTILRPVTSDFFLWSALVVAAAAIALLVWWWRSKPDLGSLVAAALPVSVLAAPHGWSYDYVALVPTVIVGLRAAYAAHARLLALAIIALTVTVLPWVMNIIAFDRNGEELFALVPLLAEALVIVSIRRRHA